MAPAMPARSVLPGPRPAPLLGWRGNAAAFYRDPLGYARDLHRRYGEVAALVAADPSVVFVLGPDAYRQLLDQPAQFPSALRLSDTLPVSLPQQLATTALEGYVGTVGGLTQSVLDRWGVGRLVDVAYVMQRLTLQIAALALLGLDQPADVARAGATLGRWSDSFFARPPTRVPVHAPLRRTPEQARAIERLIEAALLRQQMTSGAPVAGAYVLLQALLPAGRTSESTATAGLIEQVARLLLVGSELTAAALTWTLLLLSQHPAILIAVGDELSTALHGSPPTLADLDPEQGRLPLLERVIRESLRLLPPQSLELRRSSVPALLGWYQLPARALIVACPYLTQRLPEVYFAPDKFRPERWLYVEPSPVEFAPFGAGPESVLSSRLALIELKLILALLLQRYRLALAPGVQVDRAARLTLVPRAGLPMIITRADRPMIKREAHGTIRDMVGLS